MSYLLRIFFSALNRTMTKLSAVGKTLEDYNYENEMIADIILNEIADVQFMGMSVSLFFNGRISSIRKNFGLAFISQIV
jgi:hypothetical protein